MIQDISVLYQPPTTTKETKLVSYSLKKPTVDDALKVLTKFAMNAIFHSVQLIDADWLLRHNAITEVMPAVCGCAVLVACLL